MNCYPIPARPGKGHNATRSYQPFSSSGTDVSQKKSRNPFKRSKKTHVDLKGQDIDVSVESRGSSLSDSSSSRRTVSRKASETSDLNRTSTKSTKASSNKSARSWLRRLIDGDHEHQDIDPETKAKERNAMWMNMSMGYECTHLYGDLGSEGYGFGYHMARSLGSAGIAG